MSDGKIPAQEVCKCGHSWRAHHNTNGQCTAARYTCDCLGFRWSGNKTLDFKKFKKKYKK